MLWLSLPPRGWWVLTLAGLALLARALADQSLRRRALLGLVAGAAWMFPSLWWVADLTVPGWLLLAAFQSGVVVVAAAVTVPGRWRVIAWPAAFVLAEAFRWRWPLGGFPLASPVLAQVDGPFVELAPLGGPFLVLFAVALVASVLAAVRLRGAAITLVVALVALVASAAVPTATTASRQDALRIAVVQGGGPRGTQAIDTDEREVFDRHLAASDAVPGGVDLVLWPEDVVDVERRVEETPEGRDISALSRTLDAVVVAGVIEDDGSDRFRNAAVAWDEGRIVDRVDKVHRVPFGEYVPARGVVGRVVDLSRVPRDAIPGAGRAALDTPVGRLGVVISFEVFFPQRARAAVDDGGEILLVPTNASSYRRVEPAAEELAAARLRAIEMRRFVVQAAPTGYSAVVDETGTVVARTDLSERRVLTVDVRRHTGRTPYTRMGDLPVAAVAALMLAAAWWAQRRGIRRPGRE